MFDFRTYPATDDTLAHSVKPEQKSESAMQIKSNRLLLLLILPLVPVLHSISVLDLKIVHWETKQAKLRPYDVRASAGVHNAPGPPAKSPPCPALRVEIKYRWQTSDSKL